MQPNYVTALKANMWTLDRLRVRRADSDRYALFQVLGALDGGGGVAGVRRVMAEWSTRDDDVRAAMEACLGSLKALQR